MAHYEYYKRGANWPTSVNSVYEDIEPSSSWIEDTQNHYLLIDLPGFKREEVKLEVDIFGNIMVSGERKVREHKFIRFQKSTKAPEKSKSEDTSVRLEDGILYVIIPKEVAENNEHDETANDRSGHEDDQEKDTEEIESSNGDVSEQKENNIQGLSEDEKFNDAKMEKKRHERGIVVAGKEILRKNKSIVITAVLAFSFGVFISKKSKSNKINQAS
ncbi:17.5 kDa class I heat shock protein-like [Solanum verrucosum]|uniref:17.5 kDa class I heat shock protein-like n=1 Tax=Solanum verrucosum TaxID=315347 RepID=UPI0020D0FC84|nr:17.5 kDa class I heat shock protein-like [Solanum verrucosum]